jgi:glycosyltransferase involved in cell wall biosynthesis
MKVDQKKIVIANFYPVWPAMGGGQRRIFFLAKELAKAFSVEIVTLERSGLNRTLTFSPTLREIRVAAGPEFLERERSVQHQVNMAADLAYTLHWDKCKLYQTTLSERIKSASAVVSAHPYSTYALLSATAENSRPFVFDSQNVEQLQKEPVLRGHPDYLEEIKKIEKASIDHARVTIACSHADAQGFAKLYGADESAIKIIENGVDALGVPKITPAQRKRIRKQLNIDDRLVAVFGGSFHFPNFRAADRLLELAAALPNVVFLVLGSVCNYERLAESQLDNMVKLGEVDESTKWMAFNIADVGLNPMEIGSGTNVKIFEYAAAGLAIVSTPFGARGVPFAPGKAFVSAEIDDFASAIEDLSRDRNERMTTMGALARESVLKHADWTVIGKKYQKTFSDLLL